MINGIEKRTTKIWILLESTTLSCPARRQGITFRWQGCWNLLYNFLEHPHNILFGSLKSSPIVLRLCCGAPPRQAHHNKEETIVTSTTKDRSILISRDLATQGPRSLDAPSRLWTLPPELPCSSELRRMECRGRPHLLSSSNPPFHLSGGGFSQRVSGAYPTTVSVSVLNKASRQR
jgi:hypothetical protein